LQADDDVPRRDLTCICWSQFHRASSATCRYLQTAHHSTRAWPGSRSNTRKLWLPWRPRTCKWPTRCWQLQRRRS